MVGRIRYIGFSYQKSSPTIGKSRMTDENADNRPWVMRTDFSSETAWRDLQQAVAAPQREPGTDLEFLAHVQFVDEQKSRGLTPEQLGRELPADYPFEFLLVADAATFRSAERPLLVVVVRSTGEASAGCRR